MSEHETSQNQNLRHSWLDPEDEANTVNGVGFWVPSPEQIRKTIEAMASGQIKISTAQSRDQREMRRLRKNEFLENAG